jgi:hypothetical protein
MTCTAARRDFPAQDISAPILIERNWEWSAFSQSASHYNVPSGSLKKYFDHIAVDLFGPLPVSSAGNWFSLTSQQGCSVLHVCCIVSEGKQYSRLNCTRSSLGFVLLAFKKSYSLPKVQNL